MPIRFSNLDLESDGFQRNDVIELGDVTATINKTVFVAPQACRVDRVEVYSRSRMPLASTCASVSITAMRLALATATDTLLTSMTTSNSDATNAISALSVYALTPSANNSLSVGPYLDLQFSQACSTLSGVTVNVLWTPLKHKETR